MIWILRDWIMNPDQFQARFSFVVLTTQGLLVSEVLKWVFWNEWLLKTWTVFFSRMNAGETLNPWTNFCIKSLLYFVDHSLKMCTFRYFRLICIHHYQLRMLLNWGDILFIENHWVTKQVLNNDGGDGYR